MTRYVPLFAGHGVLCTALICALAAPAVAGPFTDTGTQPPLDYGISSSQNCYACHGSYDPINDLEPYETWVGSMMAQASRDPLFWAALDVANADVPGIGDWCLRCHTPTGWLDGRSEPPGGTVDGCGMDGKIDEMDNDFDGISCHLCHRMYINPTPPPGEESVYLENGQYWIDDDGDCPTLPVEPCRYGPYDYPADGVPPPHPWTYSQYHEESTICANCHNVTNPVLNLIENGVDTGIRYPIERTHREWAQSDFGNQMTASFATCQECHMPDATADPAYACIDQVNNHTGDMAIHEFVGGNAWIPDVLRQEYPNLFLGPELTATRDRALDMLQNQSATLAISGPDTVSAGGTLSIDTRVTNLTGHKLPTGYPEGRRMWLELELLDGNDVVIWESGAYDASTGVLTTDSQLKVYEAKPGVWNQNGTNECDAVDGGGDAQFHFVLNNCYKKDNRIPPLGFTPDLETKPVGYTYPETAPGSGVLVNYDDTSYSIPVPPGVVPPVTVRATLQYQTASKDYIEFLRDEAIEGGFPDDCIERSWGFPDQSRGELLYDMWQNYGRSAPVGMVTDEHVIWVNGTIGIADASSAPLHNRLLQSSPNPLGPVAATTDIPFAVAADGAVELSIFDVAGRHVRTLVSGDVQRGEHVITWDGLDDRGSSVSGGVYFYRLEVAGTTETRRLVVLR